MEFFFHLSACADTKEMSLRKIESSYDSYQALTPKDFKGKQKIVVRIIDEPIFIQTKFRESQPIIHVSNDDFDEDSGSSKIRTWFINITSFNHLIDELGAEPMGWVAQEIAIHQQKQAIKGETKNVIYALGAFQKAQDEYQRKKDKEKSKKK